jgi:hypothetical protein
MNAYFRGGPMDGLSKEVAGAPQSIPAYVSGFEISELRYVPSSADAHGGARVFILDAQSREWWSRNSDAFWDREIGADEVIWERDMLQPGESSLR